MKVVYSKRAIVDLGRIASYYRELATPKIAEAVAARIQTAMERTALVPENARRIVGRPNVRVVLVIRYPYKIFYRVSADAIEILHIRHTSRRPWGGE